MVILYEYQKGLCIHGDHRDDATLIGLSLIPDFSVFFVFTPILSHGHRPRIPNNFISYPEKAANLRQRMLNEDGTNFLRNGISSTLEKIESDETKIGELIKGREVELAEEMKFIKNIIGLLQKLNSMLKNDS